MLRLRTEIDGEERSFRLVGDEVRVGRGSDNDVVLFDFSVSRHHAVICREADGWVVYDLNSTNGVLVNDLRVRKAALHPQDRLGIGTFQLAVEADPLRLPGPEGGRGELRSVAGERDMKEFANATIVRPLSEISADFGLPVASIHRQHGGKRQALEEAYASKIFGHLVRLARLLISADSVDEVLERVMEVAFEALPVERGFIIIPDAQGELVCQLARFQDRLEYCPRETVPVSRTMVQAVMRERVALLTYDALSDQRLTGGDSIRIHQIRAAMCVPLWSEDEIIGFLQVDSPFQVGSFNEGDLDFLAALANYAAVAVQRIRFAHRAELERRLRGRLERYHSPAVIDQVMRRSETSADRVSGGLLAADVTVLFADVVGFTAFSEAADPQQVAEFLEGFFTHAVDAIFQGGGTLDKFIGDCVMAFFGAPMAQPDHAIRGVRAALDMLAALDGWNRERERLGLAGLQARVAINSGPVVVGDIGSNRRVDYTVLGNTVNVAARLEQAVAQAGEVVIGPETYRQLEGTIAAESLGELQLKGLQRRITAYRVKR